MKQTLRIEGLDCLCSVCEGAASVAYILYPMGVLDGWIEQAVKKYQTTIIVITGMDWDNVFSPWPAPGEPPGSPDFQGKSREFLDMLTSKVIPAVESLPGIAPTTERTLVGVSMSGLFALWQWMVCDEFRNIGSLSGSFWFPGFLEWIQSRQMPEKTGKGYFLLGRQESKSAVKAFDCVAANTEAIITLLRDAGIDVEFQSVPGNHFSDPIPRLDRAFSALYPPSF